MDEISWTQHEPKTLFLLKLEFKIKMTEKEDKPKQMTRITTDRSKLKKQDQALYERSSSEWKHMFDNDSSRPNSCFMERREEKL